MHILLTEIQVFCLLISSVLVWTNENSSIDNHNDWVGAELQTLVLSFNHDIRNTNKAMFESIWTFMTTNKHVGVFKLTDETFISSILGNSDHVYANWSTFVDSDLEITQWNEYRLNPTDETYKDVFYKKLKLKYSSSFAKFKVALPLDLYLEETSFRVRFFNVMKHLVGQLVSVDDNQIPTMYQGYFELAWHLINAIRIIRQFKNITIEEMLQFQPTFYYTQITEKQLHPSIYQIPPTWYHGAFLFHRFYYQFSTAYKQEALFAVGKGCTRIERDDPFSKVFRIIWLPTDDIIKTDENLLLYPSNFNSWSLHLVGAFSVAEHYLKYEFTNVSVKLVLLVADANWSHLQSLTKWYQETDTACREVEVLTPPFEIYQLNNKIGRFKYNGTYPVQITLFKLNKEIKIMVSKKFGSDGMKHIFNSYDITAIKNFYQYIIDHEYWDKGKSLQISLYFVKFAGETWEEWFHKMENAKFLTKK